MYDMAAYFQPTGLWFNFPMFPDMGTLVSVSWDAEEYTEGRALEPPYSLNPLPSIISGFCMRKHRPLFSWHTQWRKSRRAPRIRFCITRKPCSVLCLLVMPLDVTGTHPSDSSWLLLLGTPNKMPVLLRGVLWLCNNQLHPHGTTLHQHPEPQRQFPNPETGYLQNTSEARAPFGLWF